MTETTPPRKAAGQGEAINSPSDGQNYPDRSTGKGRLDTPEKVSITIDFKTERSKAYKDLRRDILRALKKNNIYTATITVERTSLGKT